MISRGRDFSSLYVCAREEMRKKVRVSEFNFNEKLRKRKLRAFFLSFFLSFLHLFRPSVKKEFKTERSRVGEMPKTRGGYRSTFFSILNLFFYLLERASLSLSLSLSFSLSLSLFHSLAPFALYLKCGRERERESSMKAN